MKGCFAIVFFGVFGAAGLFCGAIGVRTLARYFDAQNWPVVSAELSRLEIERRSGDDGPQFQVVAEYAYEVEGRRYESDQVGLFDISTNWTGTHEAQLERLQQRRRWDQIDAWVNPDDPTDSVLDVRFPTLMIGFVSIFLLSHGTVGLAGVGYAISPRSTRRRGNTWTVHSDDTKWPGGWLGAGANALLVLGVTGTTVAIGILQGDTGTLLPAALFVVAATIIWFAIRKLPQAWTPTRVLRLEPDATNPIRWTTHQNLSPATSAQARWSVTQSTDAETESNSDTTSEEVTWGEPTEGRVLYGSEGGEVEFDVPTWPLPRQSRDRHSGADLAADGIAHLEAVVGEESEGVQDRFEVPWAAVRALIDS